MDSKSVEIIPGKLAFAIFASINQKPTNKHLLHTSDLFETLYVPFSDDFGPPCTASIYHFCKTIEAKLQRKSANQQICFYSVLSDLRNATNGVFLMGAFCILVLNWKAEDTTKLFEPLEDCILHYRDASEGDSTYGLEMCYCFSALEKAKDLGWIDLVTFDYEEYTFYEQVENGDFNWIIPGKLLAFCSPTTIPVNNGETVTHAPSYYAEYFKKRGINTVIRLNSALYHATEFTSLGFEHYDMRFDDGTTPPISIVEEFLSVVEKAEGVAIHCKQGLGRTGTLNACYLMKHYDFNAAEAIAFQRIQRPGSVVGPQQHFLHRLEPKLKAHKNGEKLVATPKKGTPVRASPRHCGRAAGRPACIPLKCKTPVKQNAT